MGRGDALPAVGSARPGTRLVSRGCRTRWYGRLSLGKDCIATATTRSTCVWRFRPVPADGGETGGDPAFTNYRLSLDVFVREVIQNSLDARCPGRPVSERFAIESLTGVPSDSRPCGVRRHRPIPASRTRSSPEPSLAAAVELVVPPQPRARRSGGSRGSSGVDERPRTSSQLAGSNQATSTCSARCSKSRSSVTSVARVAAAQAAIQRSFLPIAVRRRGAAWTPRRAVRRHRGPPAARYRR